MKIKETWSDRLADFMTRAFGTVRFLTLNAVFFLVWISINAGIFPITPVFDPYPFGLLTTIVSLEAIFLSIVVLISQNRANQIAEMRSELDFEINVRSEEEITRMITMLDEIHDHMGLDPVDDTELTRMKQKIDIKKLGDQIQNRKS